jgi:hypothetical protein
MSRREKQTELRQFAWLVVQVLGWRRPRVAQLGEICKQGRIHRGLTGEEVSESSRIKTSAIYTMEGGNCFENLEKYSRLFIALGLDGDLLSRWMNEKTTVSVESAQLLVLSEGVKGRPLALQPLSSESERKSEAETAEAD